MMAIAVTTGSGLGISSDSAFMGLAQAAGMAVSGLAMFGGAKYDEMVARREEGKRNRSRENDIMERARSNVGRPEGSSERGVSGKGISYRKNAGYRKNMKNAEDTMNENSRKKHGMGVMSAKLFSAIVTGMTTDNLHNPDVLKKVGEDFGNVFSNKDFENMGSNYPYSQEYYEDMRDKGKMMLSRAWDTAVQKIREPNLDGASGSEAVRQAKMNTSNMDEKAKKRKIRTKN